MNKTVSNSVLNFDLDAKLVKQLLVVLTREQATLVMVDVDAIETLMDEKSFLLQNISLMASQRYEALAAAGFDPSESGMVAWVSSQNKPELSMSWQHFQKSITEAKEMNRLNGMLINKHFNRNQQLLNHLQGNAENGSVYGKDGQAKSQSNSRSTLTA